MGRARFYDPTTGQFLSRDPLGLMTREAYGYVGGNPVNGSDPSGMWSVSLPGDNCFGTDCYSIADQNAEASQAVANAAGGVIQGLSLGNGETVLDATTGSGSQVEWNSTWTMAGTIVGAGLLIPFAVADATAGAFVWASRGLATLNVGSTCFRQRNSGNFGRNCAISAGTAVLIAGHAEPAGIALDEGIGNLLSIVGYDVLGNSVDFALANDLACQH